MKDDQDYDFDPEDIEAPCIISLDEMYSEAMTEEESEMLFDVLNSEEELDFNDKVVDRMVYERDTEE